MEKNILTRQLAKVNYLLDDTRKKREVLAQEAARQEKEVLQEIRATRLQLASAGISENPLIARKYRTLLDKRARLARILTQCLEE
jgi:hypothetical protein